MFEDTDEVELDEPSPEEAQPHERNVRGLAWLVVPPVGGLVLGAILAAAYRLLAGDMQHVALDDLRDGVVLGAVVGGAIGAILWTCFPYEQERKPDVE